MIALFYYPLTLPSSSILWLLLPLCLSVAIIYKTVRTNDIHRLWREIIWLFAYILGGLILMGVILAAILKYWP